MNTWTFGHMDTCTHGHMDTQTHGHTDTWTLGYMETRTLGHMDPRTLGHMDTRTYGHTYNLFRRNRAENGAQRNMKWPLIFLKGECLVFIGLVNSEKGFL
jgi:hypothetical protein